MDNKQMTCLWRAACGDAPLSFTHRMRVALLSQSRKPARRVKPALAVALGLTLLLGSALALERLGLLNTLHRDLQGSLLPEATELVKGDIPYEVTQPQLTRFALEEALYDGHQVYMTLRVKPADPKKTLLIGTEAEPAWAADYQKTGNIMTGESFGEKAHAAGQILVQPTVEGAAISGKANGNAQVQKVIYHQDGSLLYALSVPASGEEAHVRLNLMAMELTRTPDDAARGTLDFTIRKSPRIKTFAAQTPHDLPLAGLTLTHCQVETTPIASYLTLRYALRTDATPLQGVNFEDGLWGNWLDENGQPRESGDDINSLEPLPDGSLQLAQSFGALEESPKDITLSFYNGMTKERFDQVTLTLSPKEDK
jgi:hypothetical protein